MYIGKGNCSGAVLKVKGQQQLKGTWASDRKLVVNADTSVTLTNSINAADQKVLDVTFTDGLVVAGSNTVEVTGEKDITIADIEDALFGTWSGTFNYTAGIVDAE